MLKNPTHIEPQTGVCDDDDPGRTGNRRVRFTFFLGNRTVDQLIQAPMAAAISPFVSPTPFN